MSIEETLEALEHGDAVEVRWLDACKVYDVRESEIDDNETFTSYQRVLGYFHGVIIDRVYKERYLILIFDKKKGKKHNIISIPVNCVMKITIIRGD